MKTKSNTKPAATISVRVGLTADDYRGIAVSVPGQGIRIRVRSAHLIRDFRTTMDLCRLVGWSPSFTEVTLRAVPEARMLKLVETKRLEKACKNSRQRSSS